MENEMSALVRSNSNTKFTPHEQPESRKGMRLDTPDEGVIACIEADYSWNRARVIIWRGFSNSN